MLPLKHPHDDNPFLTGYRRKKGHIVPVLCSHSLKKKKKKKKKNWWSKRRLSELQRARKWKVGVSSHIWKKATINAMAPHTSPHRQQMGNFYDNVDKFVSWIIKRIEVHVTLLKNAKRSLKKEYSTSAIQTQLGPSSLLEEWSTAPIVFVVSFVLSATPQTGGNGQGI